MHTDIATWKLIAFGIMGFLWLAGIVIASVAPTEEQLIEYRKSKEPQV